MRIQIQPKPNMTVLISATRKPTNSSTNSHTRTAAHPPQQAARHHKHPLPDAPETQADDSGTHTPAGVSADGH
ncbi:hypothetical protein EJ04DRAFT_511685 [Polyplosphaeria fusca]|uniref:Uncharacterized protein n=1 Tax=Polyplosphaeria fusca TaxID=682080 RepID=A0A9P4R1Z6_9PLEO|nr:hypothetical protein EJ04DRAFT_511685 [Polyplosphaeria fusca]